MTLALQVAFLTGQSDPERCALSPVQRAFLDALPVPVEGRVRVNFPYRDDTPPHRPTPILTSSWHNGRQYLASRRPGFADVFRPRVLDLLARADRTVFLAGSCGLELLGNLSLPPEALARVHVFAYGPVARHRPACRLMTVRGRGDWVSRAWRLPCDCEVGGGHMDYLANPEVLRLCCAFVTCVGASGGVQPPEARTRAWQV